MRRAWKMPRLPVGTRSLLYGYHQFLLHPLLLAWSWWRLYGFPWDPRLWVCFLVHDWGYWGCEDMDGEAGERHPELGAAIAHRLFDRWRERGVCHCGDFMDGHGDDGSHQPTLMDTVLMPEYRWRDFMLLHSRSYARRLGREPSRLCWADKRAIVECPVWLQLALMNLAGEVAEYMGDYNGINGAEYRTTGKGKTQRQWCRDMQERCRRQLEAVHA